MNSALSLNDFTYPGKIRLPEINFVGKSWEDVVRIFASNPEKLHDGRINLLIPVSRHDPLDCNGNLYFKTAKEVIADQQVQNARAIGGYKTGRRFASPGG